MIHLGSRKQNNTPVHTETRINTTGLVQDSYIIIWPRQTLSKQVAPSLWWGVGVSVVLTLLSYIFKAQQVTISTLKAKTINSKNFIRVETKET
jgi:hypothetical protein